MKIGPQFMFCLSYYSVLPYKSRFKSPLCDAFIITIITVPFDSRSSAIRGVLHGAAGHGNLRHLIGQGSRLKHDRYRFR